MKTINLSVLTALSLTLISTNAWAGGFGSDSKHGGGQSMTIAPVDYAKYVWLTDDATTTSVNHIVVSLADQRLYAYNGQQLVAWSNVSSGRVGHETPTGSFVVSEKDPDHHSNVYDNAPMPYFMRLTDNGVGLHGGFLPGYPASHGCVRLPFAMAKELFQHVDSGTQVDIVNTPVAEEAVAKDGSANSGVNLASD